MIEVPPCAKVGLLHHELSLARGDKGARTPNLVFPRFQAKGIPA